MTLDRRDLLGAAAGLALAAAPAPARAGSPPAGEALSARTRDGHDLSIHAYGDRGAAREILLIHGLGQSRLSWDRQIGPLSAHFRVVTYDLRGHGDSSKPEDEAAYADAALWADDVQAVIAAAALRRPVLAGWSLGGLVTGYYLARHGDGAVAGVNLVDAVTKLDPALLGETSLRCAPKLGSADLGERTAAIRDFLAACFVRPPAAADFQRMLVFNGMVPRVLQQAIVKLPNGGLDAAFARLKRLLVTYGARDALTRPEMSRRVLDLNPRARLSVYRQAGHSPFYEDAGRFNAELAAFAAA